MKTLLGAVTLIALTACDSKTCSDTGGCETAEPVTTDTSPAEMYDGPTYIADAEWHCDESGWWYIVETVGWSNGGDLWIYQTGSATPWDESHPIPVYDADPYGWETMLYLELAHVESANDQVDGESTLFDCAKDRQETLTWLVTVTDDLGAEADCLTWGDDTSFYAKECDNVL
ncbi:MAG: hypothetical protein GY884_34235 [Proteobacteria bacterium]|nr:hypothetical protein [Pseudomonadota bacterium]